MHDIPRSLSRVEVPGGFSAIDLAVEKSKKAQIYAAAARLFRDKGYQATSMRDLAKEVGLRASSLYNHFPSKSDVLREICLDNAQRFLMGMQEVEAMPGSATEKLTQLIRLHIHLALTDVTSVTAFNDEWRYLEEPHLSEFLQFRRDYESRFQAIIQSGIDTGEFKMLHPLILSYTLFSAVRWLYDWYKPGKKISAEHLEQEILQLLLEGAKR
jgi:AcrR family transcriptional regulator